jgi:Coenzyme PQQ synthesis protein D (PqqD)
MSSQPWADHVYAKSPDYVYREVAGEFILVPIRRRLNEVNSLYVLNETGAALWRRIDGTHSAREIIDDFTQEFDVTPEQIEKDFSVLLEDLLSVQAIERSVRPHS